MDAREESSTPAQADAAPAPDAPDAPDPEPVDDTRYLRPVFVGLLIAFGLGALALGFAATDSGKTVVPGVVGLQAETAQAAVLATDLQPRPVRSIATTFSAPGTVVTQTPAPRVKVDRGGAVDMTATVAPQIAPVPDVFMDAGITAEQELAYALYRPWMYVQLSDTVPFGQVVSQLPRAGQPVMTGTRVAVFVSMGLGSGGVPVPDVRGMKVDEAAQALADVYIVPVWIQTSAGQRAEGTVTDQAPAPGARVPVGSGIPLLSSAVSAP